MLLSIVIPSYNRKDSLNQLLLSLSNCRLFDYEENLISVIVIDDASTVQEDANPSLKNLNISFIKNHINLGAPLSRYKGVKESIGQFIHFHDSDDNITKSWLPELIQYLKENSETDILLTARTDVDKNKESYKSQKFFHKHCKKPERIAKRLVYRNCMGPLGGVTFSRRVLEHVEFKNFASCQDWQMYLDAIEHAKVLESRPDIKFTFNKAGDDRISLNPRKKILGHLQLSKITEKKSIFGRNIRLFYLYTCKQHIFNKGGQILTFYKRNRLKIIITYLLVSLYWRLT